MPPSVRPYRIVVFGAAIGAALGLSGPGFAQDDPDDARILPDTVVRASRLPTDANKVGSAVSTMTQDEIEHRKRIYSSDLLRDLPGLQVNRGGPFGAQTQVRMRGAEANQILVLMDGMEVNDPANGNEFNFGNLLGLGISRIEVLRGPQSGLYGPDALAGVISFETPDPEPGFFVEGFSELGSFSTVLGGGRLSGGTEKLRFSLFGARLRTHGVNASRHTETPFFDEQDGNANTTLHGKLKAYVTDWLELTYAGRYVNSRVEFDADTDFDGFLNDADRVTRREAIQGLGTARLSFLEDRWVTEFQVGFLTTRNRNYSNGAFSDTQEGDRLKLSAQTSYRFETKGLADAEHKIILAVENEVQRFRQNDVAFAGASRQNRDRHQTGYVAEYQLGLWDRLFLGGVARFDHQDAFANQFTWRGTLAYLHRETDSRLHASIGRGFKNPTFTEQFGFFPGTFIGNPNIKPETSIAWDVGLEQKLWGDRIVADVTFFQAWLQNEIQTFGFPSSVRNLSGTSRRHGIEFAFSVKPTKALTIRGQYTYLIAQQPPGTEEVRRPRHTGSLNVNYAFLENRANVNFGVQFNGPQRDDYFPPPTFTARRVTLGGYVLANITGSYKVTDNLEIYGRIQNLLNQRYEEIFSYQSPRIGAFAGLRLKFGGPI